MKKSSRERCNYHKILIWEDMCNEIATMETEIMATKQQS